MELNAAPSGTPCSAMSKVPATMVATYTKKNPRKAARNRSGTIRSPSLRGVTACGWTMRNTSCPAWRANRTVRITFSPPLVDPAIPPMAIKSISKP